MNDFGEMSTTGAVLSNSEMKELRRKRGECPNCGERCFKKTLFKQIPMTVHGRVLKGRCLGCDPLHMDEMDHIPGEEASNGSGRKARKSMWASTGNMYNRKNKEGKDRIFLSNRELTRNNSEASIRSTDSGQSIRSEPDYYQNNHNGGGRGNLETAQQSRRGMRSSRVSHKSLNSRALPTTFETEAAGVAKLSPSETDALDALDRIPEGNNPIDYILETAMICPHSKNIQLKAMSALVDATNGITDFQDDDGADSICHRNNIKAIMNAMEYFPSDEQLQFDCCFSLKNLSASKEMQIVIARNGGINCTINAMETFPKSVDIQKTAIMVLTKVGRDSENQLKILKRRGDKRIIDSMINHNDSIDIMNLACVAIIILAADDYSLKTGIVKANGADQIIIAMVVYSHDFRFLLKCLHALRTLSSGHDDNKIKIVSKGATDSIVSVMQLYKNDMKMQEDAARTLFELGSTPETALTIGECGGIDVLIRAIWLHSKNKDIQLQCCRALEVLSFNAENVKLMLQIGAIEAVTHSMQQETEKSEIQEVGCGILLSLAMYSRHAKVVIVEEEGLDAIIFAMVLHRNVGVVQQKACRVLNNLICEDNLDAIQAANAPELMNVAAFNFPSECNKEACLMVDTLERLARI